MINNDCSDIQVTFDKSHLSCMQEKSSPGININNNKVVSKRNTDITDMPCTPVSQRLLNIKNNNSTGNTQITNCSTPQYNSGSQQPLNMKTNKPYENNNDNLISRIDPQITQRLSNSQQNISDTSLMKNCSDNFFTKMAMTASWIRNHQDLGNTDNQSVDKSENSRNVTTDQSSNKANFDYETKDMEWTNAEPDDEIMDTKMIVKENIEEKTSVKKDPEKLRDVCIIVDTNVFISGLSKIQDIVNLKLTGIFKPLIYIPWMVITELDYMKDSCSDAKLKKNILNSIKFINTALKENNPRVTGQTVFDMDKQKQVGPSPDDKIISCCLQVAEKYETVILLSNDINLKNKAMLNNLTACSTNEVMVKIMSKLAKNNKTQKIMNKMGIMCSSVICECAKETYGDVWMKMDMLSYPPWSLVECLKRFKKYWGSVFKEKLMKQFTKVIEELLNLLQINKYICDDSEGVH
ncbi:hypothetical protein NQ314_005676 [Rhamnusium bicolor]|uniref:PIN domain-containing protein n=1 Tax=Rhamnusium bicolor TaxID=1586634 RepID=A0AAV8ZEP2_9CUCU|nr:hypothetical protein NQ314_005676 [Rhamnusium bicolor]